MDVKAHWRSLARGAHLSQRQEAWAMVTDSPTQYQEELMIWFCVAQEASFRRQAQQLLLSSQWNWLEEVIGAKEKIFGMLPTNIIPVHYQENPSIHSWLALATSKDDKSRELAFELAKGLITELVDLLVVWMRHTPNFYKQQQLYTLLEGTTALRLYEHRKKNDIPTFPTEETIGFYYFLKAQDQNNRYSFKDKMLQKAVLAVWMQRKQKPERFKLELIKHFKDLSSYSLAVSRDEVFEKIYDYLTFLETKK
ncbi:MAG: hypothetical protein ACFB0B_21795 [Thermonemataceae bacterium]